MSAPLGFNGRAASRGVPTPPAQLVAAAKKRDKFKSDAFVFPADLPSEYMFVMNTKTFKYKRKEGKETEISNLNTELDKFKKMVDESQSVYENMLDKTTKSLEEIIKNTETGSKVQ